MSITPLHIGAGYGLRHKMHFWSFAWANVIMDLPVLHHLMNEAIGDHNVGTLHDLHIPEYALLTVAVIWLFCRSWKGLIGATVGVVTHLIIDAIYHVDVMPSWGIHGLISIDQMDLLLLSLFLAPVGWEGFKWCRTKLLHS